MESLQSLWECDDDELPDVDDEPQTAPAPPAPPQESPEQPLEDGEIGPVLGSRDPDFSFHFKPNDLDAAIQTAKNKRKTKKANKKGGRRRNKTDQKKVQETNLKVFIARTSRYLKEPKWFLIEAAVDRLGLDVVRDLIHEVKTIEESGGQMVASGQRRRTPGGVLWNVLRSRYEEDYKVIMAAGRSFEKQQRQQKRKMEVSDMLIDGEPSRKRSRMKEAEVIMAPPAAQVKRTGVTIRPSRMKMDEILYKVDPENSRSVKGIQNAWVECVKKGKDIGVEMLDDVVSKKPLPVVERLRVPVQYDDL